MVSFGIWDSRVLSMVRPACSSNMPCSDTRTAISLGHVNCVTYLIEVEHHPLADDLCTIASKGGSVSCLAYLRHMGCYWDWTTAAHAAKNGHIACLKYAVKHGCPINEQTFCCAIMGNSAECLECLRQCHCPVDARALTHAIRYSKLESFKYLHKSKFPMNRLGCSKLAFEYRAVSILAYIRDHMTT
jgi:hypothetical protein